MSTQVLKSTVLVVLLIFASSSVFGFDVSRYSLEELVNEYRQVWDTLAYYSDKAFETDDMKSEEYHEIYVAGHFSRHLSDDLKYETIQRIEQTPTKALKIFKKRLKSDASLGEYESMKELYEKTIESLNGMVSDEELDSFKMLVNDQKQREETTDFSHQPSEAVLKLIGNAFSGEVHSGEGEQHESLHKK